MNWNDDDNRERRRCFVMFCNAEESESLVVTETPRCIDREKTN